MIGDVTDKRKDIPIKLMKEDCKELEKYGADTAYQIIKRTMNVLTRHGYVYCGFCG